MKKSLFILLLIASGIHATAAQYELKNSDFSDELRDWKTTLKGAETEFGRNELKIVTKARPAKPWDVQLRQEIQTALYPDEPIELRVKTAGDPEQEIAIALQSAKPPFDSFLFTKKSVATEPGWLVIRGKVDRMIPAGESQVSLTCGYGKGTLRIQAVELSFPERSTLDDVPAAFRRLQWAEEDLPKIDLTGYSLPEKGMLPNGHLQSIIAGVSELKLQGKEFASMTPLAVTGQPFTNSVLLTTKLPTEKIYAVQAHQPLVGSAEKGDVLMALLTYRMEQPNPETGYAALLFGIEEIGGQYEKLFQWGETMHNGEWRHAAIPFRLQKDLTAGAVQVVLRAGFGPQSVQIGEIALLNLGPDVGPWKLKWSRMKYGGEDPDADWRAAAAKRIEQYRKGDFTVQAGNQLAGNSVSARLIRHHFGFGSTLNSKALLPDGEKYDPQYPAAAEKMFNAGSLENAMKWTHQKHPEINETIAKCLDWMNKRDWRIRGHVLVWPSWRHSPPDLKTLKNQPEELRQKIMERISGTAAMWKGQVDDWDVINEPYTNHDFVDLLGRQEMYAWIRAAHEAAPDARLFVNDFDLLSRPGGGNPKIEYHMELMQDLVSNHVPIDGLGLQSHFIGVLTPIEHVLKMCDQFASSGVGLQITELTINIPDEFAQANYARDFITAAFSHPAIDLVQTWGFWEGRMFEPPAAMYRWNWDPKPLQKAFDELVHSIFTTETSSTIGSDGSFTFRGFYGTYEITLPNGRKTTVSLTPDNPSAAL